MNELISQNKVILTKKYNSGSVFIIEMLNMYVVLGFNSLDKEPIYSRVFFYNEKIKKNILKQARKCFNDIKESFNKKRLDLIESLDW